MQDSLLQGSNQDEHLWPLQERILHPHSLTHYAPVFGSAGFLSARRHFVGASNAQASRCSARKQRKRVTVDVNARRLWWYT